MMMQKIIITLITALLLAGCKTGNNNANAQETTTYYTCSMHPQVMQAKPGNCPICGMKLIEVSKPSLMEEGEIKLNDEQIKLGNIYADTVKNNLLGSYLFLTATLNFDPNKTYAVSARVMGRIEHLYFKTVGGYVKKGDNVFDIYSEDLNNAKQEYVSAVERKKLLSNSGIDFEKLIKSAKTKLQLWGMSDAQIETLKTPVSPVTTFCSNYSGYITSLEIKEGGYVTEGGNVLKLADLSTLWAEAQVYSSQLSQIDGQGTAVITFPDVPGKTVTGKINFVNPEINEGTRINLIRINISNPSSNLKPGMPAIVELKGKKHQGLTLPADAVLRSASGATVWLQAAANTFKIKTVTPGLETEDGRVEIKEGLSQGDVVVISGAYLLNSEYIFKNGTNPVSKR